MDKFTPRISSMFDVVRANILAAESRETGIFNIGGGEAVTINELASSIVKLCGKNLEVHVEPREGDIRHSQASIEKARVINYKPEHGLEEGLKKTMCIT